MGGGRWAVGGGRWGGGAVGGGAVGWWGGGAGCCQSAVGAGHLMQQLEHLLVTVLLGQAEGRGLAVLGHLVHVALRLLQDDAHHLLVPLIHRDHQRRVAVSFAPLDDDVICAARSREVGPAGAWGAAGGGGDRRTASQHLK